MSQVKNLRAMFENKGDEPSSPIRGRSPASRTPVDSESPRPLSKIRSNFVAVNKNGQLGLSRDGNSEPSSSEVQKTLEANPDISMPPQMAAEEPPNESQISNVPESPKLSPRTPTPKRKVSHDQVIAPAAVSNFDSPAETDPTTGPMPPDTNTSAHSNGITTQESPISTSRPKERATRSLKKEPPPTNLRATRVETPPDAMERSAKETKPVTKPLSKTARRRDIKPAPTETTKNPITAPLRSSQSRAAMDRSSAHGRLASKSPTKHIKAPHTSVMAPATTSGARLDPSRHRPSRQHNLSQSPSAMERSSSRSSVSTKRSLRRTVKASDSVINHPRPSVGPPPKKLEEHSKSARESHVDQDFLARMMRPTQASSSKTSEKAPVTPPRKPSVRRPSSSLAPVNPKSGSKVTSIPSSKKTATEKPETSSIKTIVISPTTEAHQPGHAPPTDLSQISDFGDNRSAVDDHPETDAPISCEKAQSLDGSAFDDTHAEPATVNHTDEQHVSSPTVSSSRPSITALSDTDTFTTLA